jgi:hypothetical protein
MHRGSPSTLTRALVEDEKPSNKRTTDITRGVSPLGHADESTDHRRGSGDQLDTWISAPKPASDVHAEDTKDAQRRASDNSARETAGRNQQLQDPRPVVARMEEAPRLKCDDAEVPAHEQHPRQDQRSHGADSFAHSNSQLEQQQPIMKGAEALEPAPRHAVTQDAPDGPQLHHHPEHHTPAMQGQQPGASHSPHAQRSRHETAESAGEPSHKLEPQESEHTQHIRHSAPRQQEPGDQAIAGAQDAYRQQSPQLQASSTHRLTPSPSNAYASAPQVAQQPASVRNTSLSPRATDMQHGSHNVQAQASPSVQVALNSGRHVRHMSPLSAPARSMEGYSDAFGQRVGGGWAVMVGLKSHHNMAHLYDNTSLQVRDAAQFFTCLCTRARHFCVFGTA